MATTKQILPAAERRPKVATLYLKGWTQANIAKQFGVSQQRISQDIKAIRKEWLNSALRDFDTMKEQELRRIDVLESEYWEQYEASKQDKETTTKEAIGVGESKRHKVKVTTVKRDGDPRYLQGVQWCVEQRCKILGIYEASKINVKVDDWKTAVIDDLRNGQISPDEVNELWPDLASEFFKSAGVNQ